VLKFGKEIDLEQIEKASINKEADELRDKLEKHERERLHKVQQLDEMIRESKQEQSTALQKNCNPPISATPSISTPRFPPSLTTCCKVYI